MRRLLIFLCLIISAFLIDLKPVVLNKAESDRIHVNVRGAVTKEEKVELPLYSTVEDLLCKVELAENADVSSLNPETILKDGDLIQIPVVKEEGSALVSINTAGVEELCTLPGIGQSTAERIIAYRNEHGFFQTVDELMQVKGIGEAKFSKLKDSICL